MRNDEEYSRETMEQLLEKHFVDQGYNVDKYSDKYLPARVPLHCEKKEDKEIDEIVIDITTDRNISKDDFFPDITVSGNPILEASPVRFFRYYFPTAKVYYSIPDYVEKNKKFENFKSVCEKRGIGLLETSKTRVKEILKARTLRDEICAEIFSNRGDDQAITKVVEKTLDKFLKQLVFYPEPIYKRRAIIGQKSGDGIRISLLLIKKVQELENIQYKEELTDLSSQYLMKEIRDDFTIASEIVEKLWEKYLGLKYPNPKIQINFEEIFLKEFRYREHFVHQFQVFLLGSYIIDKFYNSRKKQINSFKKLHGDSIEIAWLAASTYHDFNYSTQKYNSWLLEYLQEVLMLQEKRVTDEMSRLNLDVAAVRENYLSSAKDIFEILFQKKHTKNPEKIRDIIDLFIYENIVTERNHALLGSVTLTKIFNNSDNRKITKSGIEQAALAIALHDEGMWEFLCGCKGYLLEEKDCEKLCQDKHDCKSWNKNLTKCKILDSIQFNLDPLIYLLIMCDTVQDEGRVQQESAGIRSNLEEVVVDNAGKVLITMTIRDPKSYRIKHTEFNRVQEFLEDSDFTITLKHLLKDKKPKTMLFNM